MSDLRDTVDKPPAARPNVLLICVDQWSGRLLGEAGHPVVMTPTIDHLARNGIRYTNAYSPVPVCIAGRRSLLTGTTAQTHGDRSFQETLPLPDVPTIADAFADAGYQTYAVGKMHLYPPRSRAGFDDVLLHEEGRRQFGIDDYEMFLADQGYPGYAYAHGMGNNAYVTRPWPLSEFLHPTNWTARQMCRTIQRRDPNRPAFWYLSFNFPHPPIVPPQDYLAMYQHIEMDAPLEADWSRDFDTLPYALKIRVDDQNARTEAQLILVKRGYYAQCTYIDHQLRLVIGTLREEGILDNTIICFVSDHGDMLGHFGLFEKRVFYEDSAKLPFILIPPGGDSRHHMTDDRLVTIEDVMPTLLDLAGIPIPPTVEGQSVLADTKREYVYGEWGEGVDATRMIRDRRYKLIYYPVGHRFQLFDLERDPNELYDLFHEQSAQPVMQLLRQELASRLYGTDMRWIADGELVGEPDQEYRPRQDRGLKLQRGWRF